MAISLRCTCGAKLKANDSLAGKKVACPKCKRPVVVAASSKPQAAPPEALTSGGDTSDPLGLSAGGDLGDDPFSDDPLGDGSGQSTGDALDLAAFSESELGEAVASPLGVPLPGPSPAKKPASSPAKKRPPAKDNRTVLIAAVGGGVALVLVLVGGLVAWAVFSNGSQVAENSPTKPNATPATVDPSPAPDSQAQLSSTPSNQTPTNLPSQPNPGAPGEPPDAAPAQPDSGNPAAGDPVVPSAPNTSGPNTSGPNTSGPASQQAQIRDDNGLRMKFCFCPPGTFKYGQARSDAEITNEFWIGQTEVTQSQWKFVMQTTPWAEQKNPISGDDYPANYVSWHDATAFCARMTQVERQQGRLEGDLEYRLPTEAEWYYVSRAPRISASTGQPLKFSEFAWYEDNSGSRMHVVGELAANTWGVHDILGNLQEWTLDRFATTDQAMQPIYGGPNPFQWHEIAEGARQQLHIARGGDYVSSVGLCSFRSNGTDSTSAPRNFGFRVALAPPAKPTQPPGPSSDEVWFVLSNLESSPSVDVLEVSVDWKLAQGRPQPGKKYLIYVHLKVVNGFVGSIETMEVALNGPQGTARGEFPARDANGLRVVTHAVLGDEEGEGIRLLASGELEVGRGPTAAQPPAR